MTSTFTGITLKGSAELVAEFFCKYFWPIFMVFPFSNVVNTPSRSANMLQAPCRVALFYFATRPLKRWQIMQFEVKNNQRPLLF